MAQGALEIARTQQSNRIQKLEVERVEAEATQVQRIAVTEMEGRSARKQARIHQIIGMSGTGAATAGAAAVGIVDQVMAGMQRNAVAMPILTALGKEVGIDFSKGMDGIAASVSDVSEPSAET